MDMLLETEDIQPFGVALYPLKFDPIFQYRLWGGCQLAEIMSVPLPNADPIGEAWILSDRDDFPSHVSEGPLKEQTIQQLMESSADQLLGKHAGEYDRFPLLLKFLDAREMLSVQVHPSDRQSQYLPDGEQGKTEAWIVLESTPESRIFAGLKLDTSPLVMRQSIISGTVEAQLASFSPNVGDGVFLPAGTVHALGGGLLVFEVQQNSDLTFRLYDWDRIETRTGLPRPLQVDQALACIDYSQCPILPVEPFIETDHPALRERMIRCEHFTMWRIRGESRFMVGAHGSLRLLVCIDGIGKLEHGDACYDVRKGDVLLLPAVVGACAFQPHGDVTLLEIALPETR